MDIFESLPDLDKLETMSKQEREQAAQHVAEAINGKMEAMLGTEVASVFAPATKKPKSAKKGK